MNNARRKHVQPKIVKYNVKKHKYRVEFCVLTC